MKRLSVLIAAALSAGMLAAPGFASADIYQWEFINPADPSQGKQQSMMLCPGGAGVNAVPPVNLQYRDLTAAYLIGADLTNALGYSATLSNADLSQANLTGASFSYATLSNANFSQANLTDADFGGAALSGADFTGAEMRGANFGS